MSARAIKPIFQMSAPPSTQSQSQQPPPPQQQFQQQPAQGQQQFQQQGQAFQQQPAQGQQQGQAFQQQPAQGQQQQFQQQPPPQQQAAASIIPQEQAQKWATAIVKMERERVAPVLTTLKALKGDYVGDDMFQDMVDALHNDPNASGLRAGIHALCEQYATSKQAAQPPMHFQPMQYFQPQMQQGMGYQAPPPQMQGQAIQQAPPMQMQGQFMQQAPPPTQAMQQQAPPPQQQAPTSRLFGRNAGRSGPGPAVGSLVPKSITRDQLGRGLGPQ